MTEKTYRIGEAATLLNLKSYVLRFWETEFAQLVPGRTEKGQRLYSEENIELLRRIQYLLHEKGLTIEGARKALQESPNFRLPIATKKAEEPKKSPATPKNPPHAEEDPAETCQDGIRGTEQDTEIPGGMGRPLPGIEIIRDFMHRNATNPPYITISTTPEKQQAVSSFLEAEPKQKAEQEVPPLNVSLTTQNRYLQEVCNQQDTLLDAVLTDLHKLHAILEREEPHL